MPENLKAVLFDLDGTLLDANMDIFLPHYFEALAQSMAHILPPDQFMPRLMQASNAMVENTGQETNEEVFAAAFYPVAEQSRETLEPLFMDFYTHVFPRLEVHTRRKPMARTVVQTAFDRGYDVVIATNPLFPAAAVEQRLQWAGVADFDYDLVTTYENSYAAKPNPRYFQYIIDTLGHPAETCLMVGDEDMDMAAARVGCPTFLVPGPRTDLDGSTPEPTYRGTLADLDRLLQNSQ